MNYEYQFGDIYIPKDITTMSYADVELINKELRTNVRIARCCYNCKYFRSPDGSVIGRCVIPLINRRIPKHLYYKFPEVPKTAVCDNHSIKNKVRGVSNLQKLTGDYNIKLDIT